jgi:hypothetical protein
VAPNQPDNVNVLVHRHVNVPCPSGKHTRSLVTFRNYTVAVMFCLECEQAWTEPITHPEIQALAVDRKMQR